MLSVGLLMLLTGCGPEVHNDKLVFRYNEPAGIPTLDPAFAKDKSTIWAVQQVFEGLVSLDASNRIVPALALNWSQSEDLKGYTFHLRETKFHTGRTLEAKDVLFSFRRLLDPAVASPGSWVLSDVDSMAVVDERTFYIELKRPVPTFLSMLAMPYCSVVDSEVLDHATQPSGTGPFLLHRWHFGEKLVMHRNPTYWQKDSSAVALPYLDGLSISFLPDQQSAFLEYLNGRFDMLPNLDPSFKDELLNEEGSLRQKHEVANRLERSPFLNTEYLVFNAENELPQDLRWAINAGVDRKTMISKLRNGVGIPAFGGIIPAGLPEYSACGVPYAPDSARKIIEGYVELPELELVTVANYRDLCEFVQGALSSLGWSIAVNVVPSATLRAEKGTGSLAFFRASWIADYPDAENYLMLFYSGMQAPHGPNYSRYTNPQFDALYEQIAALPVGEQRSRLMMEADSFLMKDAALVPLFYDEVLRVFPKNVSGVSTNALNALDLRRARK
jgi:peptide/nickel transport system substrate-binding protein